MSFPQITENYFQERSGVYRVGTLLTSAHLVFREVNNADVGIDAFVEYVDDRGRATGATVAVQIKSGVSYLRDSGTAWAYNVQDKHREYWDAFPLPVLLLLHDPRDDAVYWVDVRQELRKLGRDREAIAVPKTNILAMESRVELFETYGVSAAEVLSIEAVVEQLALTRHNLSDFRISFLDIFLEGLTDVGRKLFFSAGMCVELAATRSDSIALGGPEQDFLDHYLQFLLEQSLARIDYADVLVDLREREMFPTLLMPLTTRGTAVVHRLGQLGAPTSGGITETPVGLIEGIYRMRRTLANEAVAQQVVSHFDAHGPSNK